MASLVFCSVCQASAFCEKLQSSRSSNMSISSDFTTLCWTQTLWLSVGRALGTSLEVFVVFVSLFSMYCSPHRFWMLKPNLPTVFAGEGLYQHGMCSARPTKLYFWLQAMGLQWTPPKCSNSDLKAKHYKQRIIWSTLGSMPRLHLSTWPNSTSFTLFGPQRNCTTRGQADQGNDSVLENPK